MKLNRKMRVLNPETHHGIIVNGETFKKMLKKGYKYNSTENYLYKEEETVIYRYVTNPETMKRISIESPTFLILLGKGYIYNKDENMFYKDGKPAIDSKYYAINPKTGFAVKKCEPTFYYLKQEYGFNEETNKFNIPETEKDDKFRLTEKDTNDGYETDSDGYSVDGDLIDEFLYDGDIIF